MPTRLSPSHAESLSYLRDLDLGDHLYLGKVASSPGTAVASPALDADFKKSSRLLADLAGVAAKCEQCPLSEGRKTVVFGAGNVTAQLMFVGEGPGAAEDRQGLPFVGPAGQLLNRIIAAIEMKREDVYITNIVKCRPPGNRDPRPEEIASCRSYLEQQIQLVRPRLLVALGRVAAQTLLASSSSLGAMRGRWHEAFGIPTRVTYHPAALLRNPAYKRPTWEDMQLVRDRLQHR